MLQSLFDTSKYNTSIKNIDLVNIPPIKIQGIKSKLVRYIHKNINWDWQGVWIEPFLGSGVVVFNLKPNNAILSDTNKHIIHFYISLQNGTITKSEIRKFLRSEGYLLKQEGVDRYYLVRERFNKHNSPLDFLFINRACFNGLMRFNSKGYFNTPYCHKDNRFSESYITKICNQVDYVIQTMNGRDYIFKTDDWTETIHNTNSNDFLYVDPPYPNRSNDYYNQWKENDSLKLVEKLNNLNCNFIYSTWIRNQYRHNDIFKKFINCKLIKYNHYYHIGPTEDLRNEMMEGLIVKQSL